jgi:hypothetical protein
MEKWPSRKIIQGKIMKKISFHSSIPQINFIKLFTRKRGKNKKTKCNTWITEHLRVTNFKNLLTYQKLIEKCQTRCRVFSQARNEVGVSSFLTRNEILNAFPLHLVNSWEQARSQTDGKYCLW